MSLTKEQLHRWLKARAAYHRRQWNAFSEKALNLKKYGFYVPYEELERYNEYLQLADDHLLYSVALELADDYVAQHSLTQLIRDIQDYHI